MRELSSGASGAGGGADTVRLTAPTRFVIADEPATDCAMLFDKLVSEEAVEAALAFKRNEYDVPAVRFPSLSTASPLPFGAVHEIESDVSLASTSTGAVGFDGPAMHVDGEPEQRHPALTDKQLKHAADAPPASHTSVPSTIEFPHF
eukprot:1379171-Rhodomonas_salina.3